MAWTIFRYAVLSMSIRSVIDARLIDGLTKHLCLGPPRMVLDNWTLATEYKSIDERLLGEAFRAIDDRLVRTVKTGNLNKNILAIHDLLNCEFNDKHNRTRLSAPRRRAKRKQCNIMAGSRAPLLDVDVIINALMRLYQLDHIKHPDYKCTIMTVNILAENNRIAKDPIGRRTRSTDKPQVLFPRIDSMIFDAALERAQACLPNYGRQIRKLSSSSSRSVVMVSKYWDAIFEHRIKQANPSEKRSIGTTFNSDLQETIRFVDKMANAIEYSEIGMALEFFSSQSDGSYDSLFDDLVDLRVFQFEVYLETPCCDFITLFAGILDSLHFDMKLKSHISKDIIKQIVSDVELNRQRAYYKMCRKLIEQREQSVGLIKQSLARQNQE